MNLHRIFAQAALIIGAVIFSIGLQAVASIGPGQAPPSSWTPPTTAPPGGNVYGILNSGSSAQSKVGGLLLNTGGATNGLIVQNGNLLVSNGSITTSGSVTANKINVTTVCLNGDCRTTWPSGSGGGGGGGVYLFATHVYTSNSTWFPTGNIDHVVVQAWGGGGSGGGGHFFSYTTKDGGNPKLVLKNGAGGGAGGYVTKTFQGNQITASSYQIIVGSGGIAATSPPPPPNGSNSPVGTNGGSSLLTIYNISVNASGGIASAGVGSAPTYYPRDGGTAPGGGAGGAGATSAGVGGNGYVAGGGGGGGKDGFSVKNGISSPVFYKGGNGASGEVVVKVYVK